MKNNTAENNEKKTGGITELVFILDRSGSMGGLEADTIGGFNSMIERHRKDGDDAFVTTVLFDNLIETVHDRERLSEIRPMTEDDYFVRGCTALLDAVGDTVKHISDIHRYARPEDVPARTLFVITTDGLENASRKYTADEVRRMIGEKKASGWEFIFIGANIDAIETAAAYGIDRQHAVNYHADGKGTSKIFRAMEKAVGCAMRAAPLDASWREEADEDFSTR